MNTETQLEVYDDGESKTQTPAAYNLFNDPSLMSAKRNLSPRTRDKYKRVGEKMYDFDYSNVKNDKTLVQLMEESCREISFTICNGLHPSLLDKEELDVMREVKGENWYLQYGYLEDDLTEIVTVPKDLPIVVK